MTSYVGWTKEMIREYEHARCNDLPLPASVAPSIVAQHRVAMDLDARADDERAKWERSLRWW